MDDLSLPSPSNGHLSDGGDPRVVETHISKLLFTEDHVYKVKRNVAFAFLDLSTPAARLASCQAEVALNRRLAPDIYEGVGMFRHPDGHDEPVVVMKRLPDDRRLSELVRHDDPATDDHLDQIAATLADFHARADRSGEIDADCTKSAVASLWRSNLGELREVAGDAIDLAVIEEIEALATGYLAGRKPLFMARIAAGCAVDGHGDLLADDIFCMDDGPRILDCLEFDSHLRHGDTLSDVCSLAMDLERLGRADLARSFMSAYSQQSGDTWPESLADMYVAYRATVRAKVACLRAASKQGHRDPAQVASAEDEAGLLAEIALNHLRDGRVRLVMIGGLPGTGKSTLAKRLEAATGWPLIRSDLVRKQLAGVDPLDETGTTFEGGVYTPEMTAIVYAAMLARAESLLGTGRSVILDASWVRQCWRDEATTVATRSSAHLLGFRCVAPRDTAAARITRRAESGDDPSDATAEIAGAMAGSAEPWFDAETVDTSGSVEESVGKIFDALLLSSRPGGPPD